MKRITSIAVLLACAASPHRADAQRPIDLNGAWAHRVVTTSVSKLPVFGSIQNESRFYARVQITQSGEAVELQIEPCWVRMRGEVSRVHTIVPDETVAIMGPAQRAGTLDGATLSIRRAVDVIGAKLANEWTDELPDSIEHAAQWDEDGDGQPGVTIRIMGPVDGDVYIAQRSWNSLRGTVSDSGDTIRGLVTWATEQQVLGGTSIFLKANPKSKPHRDKKKSYFEMRRMPDTTTCADIKRGNDELFKTAP